MIFFRKSLLLSNNVEEYSRVEQVTHDNTLERWDKRFACWIRRASDGHWKCI